MNKNVKALRKIQQGKKNTIINFILMISLIAASIFNLYLSIKSRSEIGFNVSEYFTNQFIFYIKNVVTIFIFMNLYSFNQIKEYYNFYYLPISVDEFYLFFMQQHKNKLIIPVITSLLTFLFAIINLGLNLIALIYNILFLLTITFIAYYLVNILLTYFFLNLPLKLYKNIIKALLPLFVFINMLPSINLEFISKYIEKYIFTEYFTWRIVIMEILLILFISFLKNVKSKLIKRIFEKSIKVEEQSKQYHRYIDINKLKCKSPLSAYIYNEAILLKKGYFQLLGGLLINILMYCEIVLSIIGISHVRNISDRVSTFIIIYMISLFVDLVIVKYSINSISFMDDFIEWIKAISLNELTYYHAKFLVKCFLNSIIFIIMISILYIVLPIMGISNNYIVVQAMVCYFNVFIMTYFDNNLDFRYQIFSKDDNKKVYIPKIKKYITFLGGKIVIVLIQQLISYCLLNNNIYISILFSYLLLAIIIYYFKENIFIKTPIKRARREEKYISIDKLI